MPGEIAEMMLDGTMCATCGEFIHDGESDGIPRYCCDECDPSFEERPKPKHDKPFFVISHGGSLKALPRFLQGVSFQYMDDSGTDKKGNPLIRLMYDKYPHKDHAWGIQTRGIIVVPTARLLDDTRNIINDHIATMEKQP